MGKVVKYCSACEEGFAEKFGFCPNCGSNLQAFEMNPLGGFSTETKPASDVKAEPVENIDAPPAPVFMTPTEPVNPPIAETQSFSPEATPTEPVETAETFEFADENFEEPVAETKSFEAEKPAATQPIEQNLYQATYAKTTNESATHSVPYAEDSGYAPTIVVEKNVKQRNTLLLGFFVLGCMLMLGSYVYSMFNKFLDIAAIDTPELMSYVGEVDPTQMEIEEEEKPPAPKDDEDGGGGGGGRDEPTPASKGREAAQVKDPLFSPSVTYDKVTNPDIAIQAATKNKNERPAEKSDLPYGLPNGADGRSDGMGTGGGQGGGRGRGQGDGNGDGFGLGNGSGRGGGNGDGEGNGSGDRDGSNLPTVKTKPIGPTEPVKILSKPRANYTDAARQNQVQGKVVLRVTFSANGSIGGISVISGLGNGLTEQAIAAARGIRFEPAKKAGVPYSVTKPVEYTFTIY